MTFSELEIGDQFRFDQGIGWNYVCIKTGQRNYETVDSLPHWDGNGQEFLAPLRVRVGTVKVPVKRVENN
jgi:hypothetical protein